MGVRYPAIVTEDPSGGFFVQFVDLDEAFTEGDSVDEALFNAAEVLTLTLEGRLSEGIDVPPPRVSAMLITLHPTPRHKACCCYVPPGVTEPLPILPVQWTPAGRKPSAWKTLITGLA